MQIVWKNDRLPTTALLHQPRIARVHYRLITKLQFKGVYGTTNNHFVAGMTAEEVQDQGLAHDTQHVHPVVIEQGLAAGRCGSPTRPAHLRQVPTVASQVYEDTYQATVH